MKTNHRQFLCAVLLFAAAQPGIAAPAVPGVVVEGVQMPAWVEQGGGRKVPLAPGMELKSGEQVRTGANARLLLRLSEGSSVKLGENGILKIDELKPNEGGAKEATLFKSTMKVLEGAFRFTTDALMKNRRREVNIIVATVTTGIRGTDLWGKSDRADRQTICLIEGRIEVAAAGESSVVMDQPRQFYRREKGATQPIGLVDAQQLVKWAEETEITAGQGAARTGGKWQVTLASVDSQEAALALYDQVRANGYAAQIRPLKTGDKLVYQVRIGSLPSRQEAEALAAQMKGKMGVVDPRVSS